MRSRLAIVVAVVIAAAAVIFVIRHFVSSPGPASLPSNQASYLGIYEKGPPDTYRPVADFIKSRGTQLNLSAITAAGANPSRPRSRRPSAATARPPSSNGIPPLSRSLKIAAGGYDGYLRSFADSVRDFGHPVVIGFGHEMNAYWYSWGYGRLPASTFIAAWRHIVTLFRQQGAGNITWLWTIQADEADTGPIVSWWPGAHYVTWVGIDGYYYTPSETFFSIFGKTIAQVRVFTGLPILLSEVSVGPEADQARNIPDLFAGMRKYGTLGLVWFDIAQHQGLYHQDWHIEDNPAAETAFRRGASTLTLARPLRICRAQDQCI